MPLASPGADRQYSFGAGARIVDDNDLIGEAYGLRRAEETARVPAANIRIGNVVATLGDTESDPLEGEFGNAERVRSGWLDPMLASFRVRRAVHAE
jgi:hypothetical protein